jgi:endonuclease III related protein
MKHDLLEIYETLKKQYGHRNWWPAKTKDEIVIGAILTQNVSWSNVRKAITNLKKAGLYTMKDIMDSDDEQIAELIRPTRFYNQKTTKLMNYAEFFENNYNYNHEEMMKHDVWKLRKQLLKVNGIGKETADSILLYALNKPIFVCDTYTARILTRLGISKNSWKYDDYQKLFMDNLPSVTGLYNDFHAQLCHLGSCICKTKPKCDECILEKICKKVNVDY